MSNLAWHILFILMNNCKQEREYGRGYMASWTLGERLGGDATTINSIDVKIRPRNKEEAALRELLDLGMVEEMEDLHCRYQLVVKEQHGSATINQQPIPTRTSRTDGR